MKRKKIAVIVSLLLAVTMIVALAALQAGAETGQGDGSKGLVTNIDISHENISISRGEAFRLVASASVSGTISWTSSDTSVATVTDYGLVVGISSGTAYITVMVDSISPGINAAQCQVTVGSSGIVSNGTYFIRNVNADKYVDVEGPSTSNGAYMQLWELTTANQRRWMFTLGTDGYYRIKSVYSSKYMRVTGSSATAGATITQNSAIVSGSKWALMRTTAGNYAFVPASSTSSLVVLNAPGTTNGYNLNTATYTKNTDYKDEWRLFDLRNFTVNNYYDTAFYLRNESSISVITDSQQVVVNKFMRLFFLNVSMQNSLYASKGDVCKTSSYGSVILSNIENMCLHATDCLTSTQYRIKLIADKGSGSDTISNVVWTGHRLTGNARSNSSSYGHSVIITPAITSTYDATTGTYVEASYSTKVIENSFTLMHELSHQLGAPDHYCYGVEPGHSCCSNTHCDECVYGFTNPRTCMMSYRVNVSTYDEATLYCPDCLATIGAHLADHH